MEGEEGERLVGTAESLNSGGRVGGQGESGRKRR